MRLYDLIEASIAAKIHGNIPLVTHAPESTFDWTKMKRIGNGLEGDIYQGRNGNRIIKAVRLHAKTPGELESNSYVNFVSACIANQHNPFFPKIHSAKIYVLPEQQNKRPKGESEWDLPAYAARSGQHMFIVVMERLHQIKELPQDEIEEIFNAIGVNAEKSSYLQLTKAKEKAPLYFLGNKEYVDDIEHTIQHEEFKQALITIKPLWQRFGGDTTLHNWMLRVTGGVRQLVMLDPITPSQS